MGDRILLALILGLSACGGGCGGTPDDDSDYLLPTFSGQLTDLQLIRVGETVVVELELLETDGTPVQEFDWQPTISAADPSAFTVTHETAPGSIRTTITSLRPGMITVRGGVSLREGTTFQTAGPLATVRAWGGESASMWPIADSIELVVGETRPTFAFPIPAVNDTGPRMFLSDFGDALSYASANPSVATVDAIGRVTAVATGSTTLTIAHGDAEVTVPVTVTAGELAPPPIGEMELTGIPEFYLAEQYDVSHLMALDARGYPSFVASVSPPPVTDANFGYGWAVVFSWTGSGWGAELAGRPFDHAAYHDLIIDDDGNRWVLYGALGVRISESHLPVLVRLDDEGAHFVQFDHPFGSTEDDALTVPMAAIHHLAPRRGGGVWAVVASLGDLPTYDEIGTRICDSQLWLIEATSDDTAFHPVIHNEVEWRPVSSGESCPWPANTDASPIDASPVELLPRAEGERFPRVVTAVDWLYCEATTEPGCSLPVAVFESEASQWGAIDYGAVADLEELIPGGEFAVGDIHVARDTLSIYDDARLIISFRDRDPFTERRLDLILDRDSHSVISGPFEGVGVWSFRRRGHSFLHHRSRSSMTHVYADGADYAERYHPSLRWQESYAFDESVGPFAAWAANDERLYFLDQTVTSLFSPHLYALPLPEELPLASDTDETTGALLPTNHAFGPAAVLADGSRSLLGFAFTTPVLYRSSGPGMPWAVTELAPSVLLYVDQAWLIRAVGSDLYTFFQGQMLRSSDGGVTWPDYGASGPEFSGWELTPDGRFVGVVAAGTWSVYEDPDVTDGFDPIVIASGIVLPSGPDLRPIIGDDGTIYLFDGSVGSVDVVQIDSGGVQPTVSIDLPATMSCHFSQGLVDASGDLLVACLSMQDNSPDLLLPQVATAHTLHRDASSGATTITDHGNLPREVILGGANPAVMLERLANGDVAVAWTYEDRELIHRQVAVRASADFGASWGPMQRVRGHGGFGQLLVGVIAEPDGGLLVTMVDTGSMGGSVANAPQRQNFRVSAVGPSSKTHPRAFSYMVRMASVPTD